MNDPNSPDLDQPLEELEDLPADAGSAAPPPAAVPAPMMGAPMMVPQPAHKQLYQFLWGGIAVFFGCLLPFNNLAPGFDAGSYWNVDAGVAGSDGPIGLMTFGGSVVAFSALLFIGAQLFCMKFRKVMLGPIALMACVAAWSWLRFLGGGAKDLGFQAGADNDGVPLAPGSDAWREAYDAFLTEGGKGFASIFYDSQYLTDYFNHIGPGYLFTLAGSTYVMVIFIATMLGIGSKKKTAAAPAAPAAKGARGGGRRR